jgi:Ca-activated chloride channel family protein
VLNGAIATIDV